MTEEEKVRRYLDTQVPISDEVIKGIVKQAYLAGLHEGQPKWHKVADGDLPKEYDTVFACSSYAEYKSYLICNYHYGKWYYENGKYDENIIAWCDIPQFKE